MFLGTLCYFAALGTEIGQMPGSDPSGPNVDYNSQSSMVQLWKARRMARGAYVAADIFIIMGWTLLIPGVAGLCVMLGGPARSANSVIYSCFVLAAVVSKQITVQELDG